jgi:ribonuclease Y
VGGSLVQLLIVGLLVLVLLGLVAALVLVRRWSRAAAIRSAETRTTDAPAAADTQPASTETSPAAGPTPLELSEVAAEHARARTELDDSTRRIAELETELQRAAADVDSAERSAAQIRVEAETVAAASHSKAEQLLREAQSTRQTADDELRAQRVEIRDHRADLERRESRLAEREDRLDTESRALQSRGNELTARGSELDVRAATLTDAEAERQHALERVAGLTAEQAKAELMVVVEHEAKLHATVLARDIERAAVREAETRAREIVVGAIQRVASEQTSESVVTAVHLPGDDMKGRIIGREGRNIRSFEQVTGVNVLIDDTPESVLLSCFDPVRRETARITLTELIRDGRIHPARIEEVHAQSRAQIEAQCLRAAEDAMAEVGITDLHPQLVPILGTLRYRTSYGQNVLKHLIECSHLAGLMAAELGLDVAQCKRSAFLHDIGKALTHEVEGSHAIIGAELARKYGEHPDVVHAIEAHHNEVEVQTVEAVLTQAADAISGGRPGARRESLEAYVQRLDKLEQIARAHEGVDKVFAMQAGREVRVMVSPEVVDDIAAQVLARDIAKQVEEELTYPGQIRVTVVRESRATETAR